MNIDKIVCLIWIGFWIGLVAATETLPVRLEPEVILWWEKILFCGVMIIPMVGAYKAGKEG